MGKLIVSNAITVNGAFESSSSDTWLASIDQRAERGTQVRQTIVPASRPVLTGLSSWL
jgi:hypothetical protein